MHVCCYNLPVDTAIPFIGTITMHADTFILHVGNFNRHGGVFSIGTGNWHVAYRLYHLQIDILVLLYDMVKQQIVSCLNINIREENHKYTNVITTKNKKYNQTLGKLKVNTLQR